MNYTGVHEERTPGETPVSMPAGGPAWYALVTRSRHEKIAARTLASLEIAHLLPLIEEERRWSDRRKTICTPLFPGYIFVHIPIGGEFRLKVRKVPGIVDFVGNQKGPIPIAEQEIESIRIALSRGRDCSPHPPLVVGERVRVVRGVLAGVEGILIRQGAQSRVVISVEIIQSAISIEVGADEIEAMPQPSAMRLCA